MIVHEGKRHKRLPRKVKKRIKEFDRIGVSKEKQYQRIMSGLYTFAFKEAWGKEGLKGYYNVEFTVRGYSFFKLASKT